MGPSGSKNTSRRPFQSPTGSESGFGMGQENDVDVEEVQQAASLFQTGVASSMLADAEEAEMRREGEGIASDELQLEESAVLEKDRRTQTDVSDSDPKSWIPKSKEPDSPKTRAEISAFQQPESEGVKSGTDKAEPAKDGGSVAAAV
eukprot:1429638-Rhodomonas_salina.1